MASPTLRAFRARALYRALAVVSAIGRRIPLSAGRMFGRGLGTIAYHLVRRERRRALRNLAIAFPEKNDKERAQVARGMFRHFGMNLFEIAWLPNFTAANRDETTDVEGIDRVLELIDSGHGVICITAHCGNWEWLSYVMGSYGRPVWVLQRERDLAEMNRYITELRARSGVRTIDRGTSASARQMIQAVKQGGMLAFVVDQNIRTDSVRVPFFGTPALTPIGPARFAIRTEAAVVVALIERGADGRQHARFLEPIQCRRDDDPVALTARLTRIVEEQIRRAPEQWVWVHDRWRDRPQWDVGRTEAHPTSDEV